MGGRSARADFFVSSKDECCLLVSSESTVLPSTDGLDGRLGEEE